MSYLRNFSVSLAVSLLCLTIGHSTYAQNRARSRVVTNRSHQIALRDDNSLSRHRNRGNINDRIHPANAISDRNGLNYLLTNRAAIDGSGAPYIRNRAFPISKPAAADTDYPIQQPIPRTYHRMPRYDNYTGDLVIPASRNIGFKLRIGNGTAYPY